MCFKSLPSAVQGRVSVSGDGEGVVSKEGRRLGAKLGEDGEHAEMGHSWQCGHRRSYDARRTILDQCINKKREQTGKAHSGIQ